MMKRIPLAAGLALAGLLVATTALAAEWQRQMHPTDCPGDADDLAWGAINEAFGANPDRLAYVCIDKYGAIRIVPLPWIRPGAGAQSGQPLAVGDLALTGSVLGTKRAEAGDTVLVAIEGLGEAGVAIVRCGESAR